MLLDDEHPGADAADRELLVALDARALGPDAVAQERRKGPHRLGRALGVDLSGRPHPAHDPQLAGPGHHGLHVESLAGDRAQRPSRRHGQIELLRSTNVRSIPTAQTAISPMKTTATAKRWTGLTR